jgi:uncharacterized membrane protein
MSSINRTALLVSTGLVLPFVVLESLNNGLESERSLDYVLLFGLLWTLAFVFVVMTARSIQAARSSNPDVRTWIGVGVRLAVVVFVAVAWAGIVSDQLPCFMGAVNCD